MYDLVIRNALVFWGPECELINADVAINNETIVCIEKRIAGRHKRIINAEGLYLFPGFIDIHGHSDLDILINPNTTYKIRQGVTTEVIGNCGFSLFPVIEKYKDEAFEFLSLLFDGLQKKHLFHSGQEYLQKITNPAVNIVPFVGHNMLRIAVNGWQKRLGKNILAEMLIFLENQFRNGISGLSTGLLYSPACFAPTEELLRLGRLVQGYRNVFSWHIRDEGEFLEASLLEAVQIAKITKASVQISHLKAAGQNNWGKISNAIRLIEKAREKGCDITFDSYPYTFGCTTIVTLLPQNILGTSMSVLINNLRGKNFRDKLKNENVLKNSLLGTTGAKNIIIANGQSNFIGKSIYEIAQKTKKHIIDLLCDLIIKEKGKTSIFLKQIGESDLKIGLAYPEGFISTDGIPQIKGRLHPRLTNSYPHFLNYYVMHKHLCTLQEAVKKMSIFPAKKLGLQKRGEIKIGNYADLCIFNPAAVNRMDVEEELKTIKYVITNGQLIIDNEEFIPSNKAGKILTKGSK